MADPGWLKTTKRKAEADGNRLRQLVTKRNQLDSEIQKLTEMVRSWQVILADNNGSPVSVRAAAAGRSEKPDSAADVPSGLRDAIRGVLAGQETGLKPKEVTSRLLALSFRTRGRSDLGIRVNGELWRMAKVGLLRRVKSGYMLLKGDGSKEEASEAVS